MAIVLIADNDQGVRSLLVEVVRRLGCEVREAADGAAAQALMQVEPVQVLVCDLDMPRMSGEQLLDWVARQPSPPATVVVSGYLDAPLTARLRALPPVRALLRKPFDVLEFAALVRRLGDPARSESAP
jgi:CheY-like chemotaxis protein